MLTSLTSYFKEKRLLYLNLSSFFVFLHFIFVFKIDLNTEYPTSKTFLKRFIQILSATFPNLKHIDSTNQIQGLRLVVNAKQQLSLRKVEDLSIQSNQNSPSQQNLKTMPKISSKSRNLFR